jgi:hypothetical protein
MKLLFAAVITLALTVPAWAGRTCFTHCNPQGDYCSTSCYDY